MAYHSFSAIDIPGLLWCAPCRPCRQFRSATSSYCREFGLPQYFFAVISIIKLVECAPPSTSLLKGKSIQLALSCHSSASLSVSLNTILAAMICFHILCMRALTREVLSPEVSKMYMSIVAMLIESATPVSILGIGLVVTAAQKGSLVVGL